ncbi:MAG: hypothetical protein C4346_14230 [Chloroflexota bacterium]
MAVAPRVGLCSAAWPIGWHAMQPALRCWCEPECPPFCQTALWSHWMDRLWLSKRCQSQYAAKRRGWLVLLVRIVDLDEIVREMWLDRQGDLYRFPKDEAYEEARKRCEAQAAAYLAKLVERLRQECVQAGLTVATGTPAFVLLDLVQPGDLVVMTSHGRGGLRRWLIGSVAEKLIREAPAPVLIVRPQAAAATS